MRRTLLLGLLVLSLPVVAQRVAQTRLIQPDHLTTEFRTDPVGIGTASPAFGWKLHAVSTGARNLRQTAYRVRLASSPAQFFKPSAALWDSGRIDDPTYWQRPYAGPALHSSTTYFWQVQAWSGPGAPGPWSAPAHFTTALLSDADWSAHWIAAEPDRALLRQENTPQLAIQPPPRPVFRHDFALQKPVATALLFVAGLGQYEVRLNGSDITDTVMNSGWTDYSKTVFYDTYDVGKLLHRGSNAFGVLLGNGMYNVEDVKGHYTKFSGSFGQPKCILQLEVRYTDGTSARFTSDRSWQTHSGPITYSSTFGGEAFDARALPSDWDRTDFPAERWNHALEVSGPGGRLIPTPAPPLAVAQTYPPVRTTSPRPGVVVYDLGQNMSGWPAVTVRGPAGSTVHLLAGELLNPDGTVSQKSANAFPDAPVLYSYTLRGEGRESWHPRFAYYSFRYVQVTTEGVDSAAPEVLSLTGNFVHARVETIGTFSSSNDLFQRIHVLIDRAVLSNLASVLTDCPSREKLGWLEQTYLNAATLMLNYDVTGLYEKVSDDMRDSQLRDGLVPSTAPEYVAFLDGKGKSNAFRDSPEWGSAVILSPWALYQFTGDKGPLEKNYASMKRYAAFLQSRASGNLLSYGLGDWYDIGPKAPGPSQLTSTTVTATGVFYEDLRTLAQIAALLGRTTDQAIYTQQSEAVRMAFQAKLFHPDTSQYDRGSQTANALPLALGLVPPDRVAAVLDHLVADIHAHGDHVTAGDVGFHYVVRALTDYGRSDVLAAMFSRTDSPSYGYQLARGATTLTEAWDANPASSQNHFMLGHGEEWFYRGLAGLAVDMSRGPGDAIHLRPSFLAAATNADTSFQAPMGVIHLAWKRSGPGASVEITVPAGAVAHLALPGMASWQESGKPVQQAPGVLSATSNEDGLQLILGSGTFHLAAPSLRETPAF